MKRITSKSEIPVTPHWAILEFSTITIPGDETSRSRPGHGYPESRETVISYLAYDTESEWVEEISKREKRNYENHNYVAMKIVPATIKKSVSVDVSL